MSCQRLVWARLRTTVNENGPGHHHDGGLVIVPHLFMFMPYQTHVHAHASTLCCPNFGSSRIIRRKHRPGLADCQMQPIAMP
jgi:hypothetical protein